MKTEGRSPFSEVIPHQLSALGSSLGHATVIYYDCASISCLKIYVHHYVMLFND
jgi:hypothetical protein